MTIVANRLPKDALSRVWGHHVLGWWLAELTACGSELRRILATHHHRSVTIEAGERYWVARCSGKPIGQIEAQSGAAAQLRSLMPPNARRRPVIVEIPAGRALGKTIVLPPGASSQLARILDFEITRHFPFPAERAYFQHRVVGKREDGAVAVEIVAVPRGIVDGICGELAEVGLRPAAIAACGGSDAKPLWLPSEALGAVQHRIRAPATRWLCIALTLAALLALASWPLAQEVQLGALDREAAALKPSAEAALRAREAAHQVSERSATVLALRASRPALIAALDRLSRDLPDNAWLLSLSIAGREVVLDGLAPSAASIALALEKSGDVGHVVFRSPITRDASGLEHFQLGITLGEAKP